MVRMIGYAGPFAAPLGVLTALLVILIARAALGRKETGTDSGGKPAAGAAILFWGFVAAVLGFLGQCATLYRILRVVVPAAEISPQLLAEGFAASFVPTLWGVGLLMVAGLAWISLRGRRTTGATLAAVTLVLLGAPGCGRAPASASGELTRGAWAGDGGPDTFLFELRGSPESLAGSVHVMRDGKMVSQLAITRASYQAPDLELYIESTDATYRGSVDLANGRIRGGLSFGGRSGPDMALRWIDPSEVPGYAALKVGGTYAYRQPSSGHDGWEVAAPEDVGLSTADVEALVTAVAGGDAGLIHSLQVVRGGKLVLDEYFHGYGPDDLHRLASDTKSISSLLVGIAVDRGLIAGVDVSVTALLGEMAGPGATGWEDETLRDLLTMTMGLDWSSQEADATHGTGPDFFRQVVARKVVSTPGERWAYVSANVDLLAGILFNATGRQADEFAGETLFGPLGITSWNWDYGKEAGFPLMDGSLRLRPRDMAKVGALVLAGGAWDGRQVVSKEWIAESTQTHVATGEPLSGYGYLWWTGDIPTGQGPEPAVVANGWGSQFILVFPRLDMVVVTTGGNDDNGRHTDIGPVLSRTLLAGL